MDVLEVLEHVTTRLRGLSIPQLLQVCEHLEVEPGDAAGRTNGHQRLVRKVVNHLNSDEIQDREDGGSELLQGLKAFIEELAGLGTTGEEATLSAPPASPDSPAIAPGPAACVTTPAESQRPALMSEVLNIVHREFKISGQIGEPGQRDRLTFTSLANQIEAAQAKGYRDGDIVQGVIRAIVPGSSLRSYLEGRVGVTLPSLRRLLRCHYLEKDATDLYKELAQLAQDPKESSQAFLLRALDLRQKVIFASQESESGLCYDKALVQRMFCHTILTGLRNDNIKSELRPQLEDPNISDELLFEKLNACSSLEAERRKKLRPIRPVAVSEVQDCPQEPKPQPKPGLLTTQIAQLQADMAELVTLKTQVAALTDSLQRAPTGQAPRRAPSSRPPMSRGCRKCQEDGTGSSCDHCFRCGSSDHFARGCRNKKDVRQGNGDRLLPRDRE